MARTPDHSVDPMFVDRWSPRSFTGEPVPDGVLHRAFEAARWAPSGFNAQPWRFIVAKPGDPAWPDFVDLLLPHNRRWAARASALIAIVSALESERNGAVVVNRSHSFDSGAAWANFAHQAHLLGWATHGIGGFDRDEARVRLKLPDDFALEAFVALGKRGSADTLDDDLRAREAPTDRRPIAATVFAGHFGAPAFIDERKAK